MSELRLLGRYAAVALAVVGGLEWLLGRTISRLAASPALEGTPRDIVEGSGRVGLFLVSPAFVLAFVLLFIALSLAGLSALRAGSRALFSLVSYLFILLAVVGVHTMLPSEEWLNISFNLLMLAAVEAICIRLVVEKAQDGAMRAGVAMSGLAYAGWYLYVLEQLVARTSAGEGAALWLLGAGELAVIFSAFAFFVALVRGGVWRRPRRWVLPFLVALLFAGGNISDAVFNQGFTAIFSTWSVGLNLAWPWPLYAVALALFAYAVLTCLSAGPQATRYANPNTGIGLLFLLYGGYNLQIPYQHLLAVLGLMLLTGLFRPFGVVEPHEDLNAQITVQAEHEALLGVRRAGH